MAKITNREIGNFRLLKELTVRNVLRLAQGDDSPTIFAITDHALAQGGDDNVVPLTAQQRRDLFHAADMTAMRPATEEELRDEQLENPEWLDALSPNQP